MKFICVIILLVPINHAKAGDPQWDAVDNFVPSPLDYDRFDWMLMKMVASLTSENVLVSPLGLKLALAILKEAASGSTGEEMGTVLGFDENQQTVREKFSSILDSLQTKSSQYILNLGSRIYVNGSSHIRQKFAAIAEEFYKTEVKEADFSNAPETVKQINNWVNTTTNGWITDLVQEENVAGAVLMVLNAIYFKGTWRYQFSPNDTTVGTFFVDPQTSKQVPFMTLTNSLFYVESTNLDAKILRIPYLGNKFSMYMIVSNSISGLPVIMNQLQNLRTEMASMKLQVVNVTIPKFNYIFTSNLESVLKDLGIKMAFDNTMASFPGLSRGQRDDRLCISKVLQRAGFEANEAGSIAYSATEIDLTNKIGNNYATREVTANVPFLFYIEDEATRQLLFIGRVMDPTQSDGILNASQLS